MLGTAETTEHGVAERAQKKEEEEEKKEAKHASFVVEFLFFLT